MKRFLLIVVAIILNAGCSKRQPVITIVDIGISSRVELGKHIRTINRFSPKIVALDFHLVPDSLDKDTILVKEIGKIKNSVQVVSLHNFVERLNIWDSLESSNPKFRVMNKGFSNLTTEDSVLVKELPMVQLFGGEKIYAFSYMIAENSYGVKAAYRDKGDKDIELDLNSVGENYKLISIRDLVSGNFKKEDLTDKIVLLGYIGDDDDYFYLTQEKRKKVNGVEIHAAIVDEIIDF